MCNNCLWFIEQAWKTLFKPFLINICKAYLDFTNEFLNIVSLKKEVFAEVINTLWILVHSQPQNDDDKASQMQNCRNTEPKPKI